MSLGVHVATKKVLKEEQLRTGKTVQSRATPELSRQTSNEHTKPTTNETLFVHDKHVFLGERFRDDIITIDRSPALEAA